MAEKNRALFRGATDAQGLPAEWLGTEPPNEPGQPETPAVPARHLTHDEYEALTPRNKERVREARAAGGGPLYEVRSVAETRGGAAKDAKEGGE